MRIERSGMGGAEGGNFLEHQVQQGDTLESVAGQYSTTKQTLLEVNRHVTDETLKPGMVLQIPQPKTANLTNIVGDTLEPFDSNTITPFFESSEHGQIKEIPTFAPPYVPVGPVLPEGRPGPTLGDTVKQAIVSTDQFHISEEGNLVINNPDLIRFFQELVESAPDTQQIQVAIAKLKPSSEE